MILRDIDFGPIWMASGLGGFFGEGYRIHKFFRVFRGFNLDGATFCAKTMTLDPHKGNMALDRDFRPFEIFPDCVVVKLFDCAALNAVSLSNPGFVALFDRHEWEKRKEPFFLSWATTGSTREERLIEAETFAEEAHELFSLLKGRVGLQFNLSCPNFFFLEHEELLFEAEDMLERLSVLDAPLVLKLSALSPPAMVEQVSRSKYCDALCVSNSVHWDSTREIDWESLFGPGESPLARYGGGSLSGKPLFPLVRNWVMEARRIGIDIPINAGGGIFSSKNVRQLKEIGADSVLIGVVAMLRPWRVSRIIEEAHRVF